MFGRRFTDGPAGAGHTGHINDNNDTDNNDNRNHDNRNHGPA